MQKGNDAKVVLVAPPERSKSMRPPLGLMYISSYLTKFGINNSIIDIKSKKPLDEVRSFIEKRILELNPKYLGLSCLTTELDSVLKICNNIKSKNPKIKIILGGIHPTLFPEEVLKHKSVDIVVVGEGEITFAELLKKEDPKNIHGVYYKKANKIIKNLPREKIHDLDSLPMPAFDKVPMDYYLKVQGYLIRGVPTRGFYIFTSRGCPYRCEFCVNKNIFGRSIRYRSPKKVVDEIEYLMKRYTIDSFFIYDDTFTAKKDHVLNICKEIKYRKLKVIWGCETRVNLLDENIVKAMKKSGCIQIDFGMESGSQRLLNVIKKDITIHQIKNAVRLCNKYNIRIFSNFMINLPTETKEEMNETIKLAQDLHSHITVFNITTPFPGTDLFDHSDYQLTINDYKKLTTTDSIDEYINFIEAKCRLSEHKIPIKIILSKIALSFPSRGNFKPRFNLIFLINLLRYFSFLKNKNYISSLFRTKHKIKYLKYIKEMYKDNL
jgi:radical SAM superfamily enzyme YgiQ (UPF0313 family)